MNGGVQWHVSQRELLPFIDKKYPYNWYITWTDQTVVPYACNIAHFLEEAGVAPWNGMIPLQVSQSRPIRDFWETNNRNHPAENRPRGAAHDAEGCWSARALLKWQWTLPMVHWTTCCTQCPNVSVLKVWWRSANNKRYTNSMSFSLISGNSDWECILFQTSNVRSLTKADEYVIN